MYYTLVGVDGNAFAVMGYVTRAMKREGYSSKEIDEYRSQAMSSDYHHLLAVSCDYVEQCNDRAGNDEPEDGDDDESEKYTLVGVDGNAFAVMGYVMRAMRNEGFSSDDVEVYRKQATSSDYTHLLAVSCDYVEKCNRRANGDECESFTPQDAVDMIRQVCERYKK